MTDLDLLLRLVLIEAFFPYILAAAIAGELLGLVLGYVWLSVLRLLITLVYDR